MKYFSYLFLVLFLLVIVSQVLGQDGSTTTKMPVLMAIPPNAKLNMSSTELRFSIFEGEGANRKMSSKTFDTVWINYSSIVAENVSNRIFASLAATDLPAEISIKLNIKEYKGNGYGKFGVPSLPIFLSTTPQTIITDIGSCFTGLGKGVGHMLIFSWELSPDYDPDLLSEQELMDLKIRVLYTINSDE